MGSQSLDLDRRRFLSWASAAGTFFAAHGFAMPQQSNVGFPLGNAEEGAPRIRSLELLSSAPLPSMKEFYQQVLGLRVIEDSSQRLTINAGETRISFLKAPAEEKEPFYHFAFNIPENKVLAAHQWQKKRTPLLPIPKTLRDPRVESQYPDDVVDYRCPFHLFLRPSRKRRRVHRPARSE